MTSSRHLRKQPNNIYIDEKHGARKNFAPCFCIVAPPAGFISPAGGFIYSTFSIFGFRRLRGFGVFCLLRASGNASGLVSGSLAIFSASAVSVSGSFSGSFGGSLSGRVIITVKRSPFTVTWKVPPQASVKLFAIERPRPLPEVERLSSPRTKRAVSESPSMVSSYFEIFWIVTTAF